MSLSFSFLSHLECARCHALSSADIPAHLCACGSPLLARYDLDAVQAHLSKEMVCAREPSLWRYHELLPVRSAGHVVTLGEGMTPLLALPRVGLALGMTHLL